MNIYIKIEVLSREIEGRLLLALTAAERGHDVLLGDLRSLLAHRQWLPSGVFHDKSLTPSRKKASLHRMLHAAGFVVSSQDEEHGLLEWDYSRHAQSRFSEETLETASFALMWGPHDAAGLEAAFPAFVSRIHATGSPRVDLWKPSSAGVYRSMLPANVDRDRPLILIAAHGHGCLSQNRFWDEVRNARGTYLHGPDDQTEWELHESFAIGATEVGHLARILRHVLPRFPEAQFVLRPHPSTADGAWESFVGSYPNFFVRRDRPVGPWIRSADLVVHDSSTVGFEAAIAGVPLASFTPAQGRPELATSQLGRPFRSADELAAIIESALGSPSDWFSAADRMLLTERFGDLGGSLACDRIVDVWETVDEADLRHRVTVPAVREIMSRAHRRVGTLRADRRPRNLGGGFKTAHKFPAFDRSQVRRLVYSLRSGLDRFEDVQVRFHGPRLLSVRTRA